MPEPATPRRPPLVPLVACLLAVPVLALGSLFYGLAVTSVAFGVSFWGFWISMVVLTVGGLAWDASRQRGFTAGRREFKSSVARMPVIDWPDEAVSRRMTSPMWPPCGKIEA